jgi:hypothetical protein
LPILFFIKQTKEEALGQIHNNNNDNNNNIIIIIIISLSTLGLFLDSCGVEP